MRSPTGGGTGTIRVVAVSQVGVVWGAEQVLFELRPLLAEAGVELALACPPGTELASRWVEAGGRHVPLTLPAHTGLRRPVQDTGGEHGRDGEASRRGPRAGLASLAGDAVAVARSAVAVRRVAAAFDVVHSNSLKAHVEVAAAGRVARRPVVLSLHDLVGPGAGRVALGGAALAAAMVVANSTATATAVPGPARSRVRVIHPGVDLKRFSPGPADPGVRAALGGGAAPLVGIVGRLDPRKGIDVVIEAMSRLTGEGARAHLAVVGAVFVGSPGYADRVREAGARLIPGRLHLPGARSDMPAVIGSLDVLVNASPAEPFGMTVLEAHAAGTPVVATAAGGIPDFVADGETGLLVPPGDVNAMAAAIQRVLDDAALRHRITTAARRQAEARFGWDTIAGQWAAAYRAAAGRIRS